uniref:Uncharacterized protein n=1 Tax=Rhizophora mucronata TaxID=61149 RepID=A0A2P2PU19_RHIMU
MRFGSILSVLPLLQQSDYDFEYLLSYMTFIKYF